MTPPTPATRAAPRRVLVLGATGTIGQATVRALVAAGHIPVCILRPSPTRPYPALDAETRHADLTDPSGLARDGIRGEPFDALVSCMASRTGAPGDAWAIDHRAHIHALAAAHHGGIPHFVLLSAICVQKPRLQFQHAKLAFEAALVQSGLTWSIIRPTAYFKSLSGQVERVRRGKPYLVFGNGTLTACKPIADDDLARYLVGCLDDPARHNRILPIGGPGPALTPLDMAHALFTLANQPPRVRHVPLRLLDAIIATLSLLGRLSPRAAAKAELARIGRYYATESMLVWDAEAGRYDEAATPSVRGETLPGFYGRLLRGETTASRGDHAVF